MSEADRLFEKQGYDKIDLLDYKHKQKWGEGYKNSKRSQEILFDFNDKSVCANSLLKVESIFLTMQELKAINKKCEELKWI